MEMESVSDDEEEDFWGNTDLDAEDVLVRRESEGGPGVNRSLSLRPVLAKDEELSRRETIFEVSIQCRNI
jgi:hypothetical protein